MLNFLKLENLIYCLTLGGFNFFILNENSNYNVFNKFSDIKLFIFLDDNLNFSKELFLKIKINNSLVLV